MTEAWDDDEVALEDMGALDELAPPDAERPDPTPVDLRHVREHAFVKEQKRGCGAPVDGGGRCGRAKLAMCHVGTPQSLNVHGSGANHFTYQTMKKNWTERLTALLEAAGLPRGLGHVHAEGQACFPDRRKRDQGNHRFILEKSLGDALVEGGWLPDDDWDHYEFGRLHKAYAKGESWTAVTVYPAWAVADGGAGG